MNIQSRPVLGQSAAQSSVQFGAVYKKDPGGETAYFTYDSTMQGHGKGYYATGEDKDALVPLQDSYNDATERYTSVKYQFLLDSGYCDEEVAGNITSLGTSNILKEENNEKCRKMDNRLILNYPAAPNHAAFVAVRNTFESLKTQYLAKIAELAQKAQ